MTYLQILNTIKDTALAQPNVNSVVREFLDLNREDAKYSAVVIQDRDGSRDRIVEQDYVTYTWHLGYVDRLTYDESNRDDIISTGINIINNIVNTIRNTWFPELEVSIVDRINTFDQRFTAQCAGVYVVLSVNAQVSDCIDSESTDLYDTYDAKITANGVYHFVPSGRPVDEINITVDVAGSGKEEVSLTDTVTMNGIHTYIPEENTVYKDVELTVDVHPTERLVQTYTTNGVKTITGEFNGGTVNVDVHPSDKLIETITSNGTTDLSGEWKDAAITVAVPSDQKPETICEKVIQENGSFHYYPESGEVFNDVHITTDVHPSDKLVETITNNGSYSYPGEYAGAEITVSVSAEKPEESLEKTITSNGSFHYDPSAGSVFSKADITVDVHPSSSLSETYTTNGVKTITGEFNGGTVNVDVHPSRDLYDIVKINGEHQWPGEWKSVRIAVDVHPSDKLVKTITNNGTTDLSGEWKDASITVDVHPSNKLVETITSNGTTSFSGEWKDADITVSIPEEKPEESLEKTITSNGNYHYNPSAGSVFSGADITVNCPVPKTEERGSLTISSNGSGTLMPSSGNVFDGVDYVVDVHPTDKLVETITNNGTTSFSGEWKDASITVDVHPTETLSKEYTTNGTKTITGEFNGGSITINVHPTSKLSKTYTKNGTYNVSGEWKDASITVDVPTNVNANTLRISQTEYDNLSVKDPDTIYLIYY